MCRICADTVFRLAHDTAERGRRRNQCGQTKKKKEEDFRSQNVWLSKAESMGLLAEPSDEFSSDTALLAIN